MAPERLTVYVCGCAQETTDPEMVVCWRCKEPVERVEYAPVSPGEPAHRERAEQRAVYDCAHSSARYAQPCDRCPVERAAAEIARCFQYELSDDEEMYDRAYWMDLARRALSAAGDPTDADFMVRATYRVGCSEGQGGVRMFGPLVEEEGGG